jgi:hypothetical protein
VADESVAQNLERMGELDFAGWNGADWEGVASQERCKRLRTQAPM